MPRAATKTTKAAPAAAAPKKTAPKTPAAKATTPKATKAKKEETVAEEPSAVTKAAANLRTFSVQMDTVDVQDGPEFNADEFSKGGGLYKAKDPRSAACRAFTKLCRSVGSPDSFRCVFSIKETTTGSKGRVYTYVGTRSLLDEPKEMKKGDTSFTIRFSNDVKAYKPETPAVEAAPVSKPRATRAKKVKEPEVEEEVEAEESE